MKYFWGVRMVNLKSPIIGFSYIEETKNFIVASNSSLIEIHKNEAKVLYSFDREITAFSCSKFYVAMYFVLTVADLLVV